MKTKRMYSGIFFWCLFSNLVGVNRGFNNPGATYCFLNAPLQVLSHSQPLNDFFIDAKLLEEDVKDVKGGTPAKMLKAKLPGEIQGTIVGNYLELITELKNPKKTSHVDPTEFRSWVTTSLKTKNPKLLNEAIQKAQESSAKIQPDEEDKVFEQLGQFEIKSGKVEAFFKFVHTGLVGLIEAESEADYLETLEDLQKKLTDEKTVELIATLAPGATNFNAMVEDAEKIWKLYDKAGLGQLTENLGFLNKELAEPLRPKLPNPETLENFCKPLDAFKSFFDKHTALKEIVALLKQVNNIHSFLTKFAVLIENLKDAKASENFKKLQEGKLESYNQLKRITEDIRSKDKKSGDIKIDIKSAVKNFFGKNKTADKKALVKKMMTDLKKELAKLRPLAETAEYRHPHPALVQLDRGQQDSEQFLGGLLDSLLHTIPDVSKFIQGNFIDTLTCLENPEHIRTKDPTPFAIVSVAIPGGDKKSVSLIPFMDCLDNNFVGEDLEGVNCVSCNKKVTMHKSIKLQLSTLPKILFFQIKIYGFNLETAASYKISNPTPFPFTLTLKNDYFDTPSDQPVIYKLRGLVLHAGETINSGHYTAFARDNDVKDPDKQWAYFNDLASTGREPYSLDHMKKIGAMGIFPAETASSKMSTDLIFTENKNWSVSDKYAYERYMKEKGADKMSDEDKGLAASMFDIEKEGAIQEAVLDLVKNAFHPYILVYERVEPGSIEVEVQPAKSEPSSTDMITDALTKLKAKLIDLQTQLALLK